MITIKLEGLSELQTVLRQLPDATAKNVLRRVMKECLQPIAEAARRYAPVDEGELRDSITVGTRLSSRQKRMHRKVSPDDVDMFAGAGPIKHAHLVEFGSENNIPHPYMRPAWDQGKDDLLMNFKGLMWLEIDKAANRLAKKAAKG
jgi:HK97 gp10 family phage protein